MKKQAIRKPRRKGARIGRNGIPVFDRDQDIRALFRQAEEDQASAGASVTGEPESPCEPGNTQLSGKYAPESCRVDRNGLPVLDHQGRLSTMLMKNAGPEPEASFSELLDASLTGMDQRAMMKKKKDAPPPNPVPLSKRLKRYPPPENDLDLHGFDARRAMVRAESFVRSSWRQGLFTLRIVVGRGLHSENGAVLPDVVEDLLARLKGEGIVLHFDWDRKRKRRSGSVIVFLKQHPD